MCSLTIPRIAKLTEEEKSLAPNSASPRYKKIVRIAVIPLAQAGWLTKDEQGLWRITREGYDAGSQFTNPRRFTKRRCVYTISAEVPYLRT